MSYRTDLPQTPANIAFLEQQKHLKALQEKEIMSGEPTPILEQLARMEYKQLNAILENQEQQKKFILAIHRDIIEIYRELEVIRAQRAAPNSQSEHEMKSPAQMPGD